ncbi:MAG: ABC transporter ATP-binding protein/permease [Acidimicrobiia bacterium]|nr:ABC transporter ATP-binding protein/permease [Acidimicrobiia bacterium]
MPADDSTSPGGRRGWRLLWETIKEERAGIIAGMLASLGWTAGRVAVPLFVQFAVDRGIRGGGPLLGWALLITLAGLVSAVFLGIRRYVAFRNARVIEARLRDRIFAHIQRLHFAFHDSVATGELMSRGNTDLQHFQNVITLVPLTTGNLMIVVAVTIIMLVLQPTLAVLALIALPLVNVLGKRFASRLHPAVLGIQQESAQLASVVEETVAGVRVVKGFGSERVQAAKLAHEADDVYRESMRAARTRATYLPGMELLPNVALIVVLGYGGHLVLDGQMTVGELVSFNIYVLMLVQPLRMLGMVVANGQRAAAAGQRIDEVLATEPQIADPVDPVTLPDTVPAGRVEFRGVDFAYHPGTGAGVLEGLDLVIEPGESVALVGPTGSGKSTIGRLLPRFYEADGGSIWLDGIDVRRVRRQELRRAVGVVFEETFLFSASVRDNIAFADPDASFESVVRAARLAGAHEFVDELPDGYDTELGERGFSLSGGQRQRLAIARAILADPRVLILDDATSAVDPTKEHEIRDALGEVMSNRTTIVIAHRPATIALADRVVLLDEGRIVAEGTHHELLDTSDRYRSVLAADATDTDGEAG